MIMELLYKKYASYNVLAEEHRTFVLDIIKPLLFDGEKAGWNYSENYSGNGMHTHPGLHLNPKLRLFYDRVVEDFKTLVRKEPVIKNSWALWTNGQYVNWHTHQTLSMPDGTIVPSGVDFSIVYYLKQHPTIGRSTQFEDGSAVTSPQNSLLIFDSKISHSVPSSTIKINRYSIVIDVSIDL